MKTKVVIIGGGLAGLHAAYRLEQASIDYVLIEARDRLGGRILTVDQSGQPSSDGFDLGPSWFWPAPHSPMAVLIAELGLEAFPQFSWGDLVSERGLHLPIQRYPTMEQATGSMRLMGGTSALITALAARIQAQTIITGARVTNITRLNDGLKIGIQSAAGVQSDSFATHAIVAVPPRLVQALIQFEPTMDQEVVAQWRDTPTWMAPQAKFFATYESPFWREKGLSGEGRSLVGPLVEIHDATTSSGEAALFGFIGVPAEHRSSVPSEFMITACVDQLVRLFGPEAADPVSTLLQDWAFDGLTATLDDLSDARHPEPNFRQWTNSAWAQRVSFAASETSHTDPGYMAGAVEASGRTVRTLLDSIRSEIV
jgi:monoamine oxidase